MDKQIWDRVNSIDLRKVRAKLASKKSWWWLFWHNLADVEADYRKFLYMIAKKDGQVIVPWNDALDDFWHEHILDTAKYEADCQVIFGKFIHHNPHLDVGTAPQVAAFRETKKAYQEEFGCNDSMAWFTPLICGSGCSSSHSDGGASCGASCGSSCGGGGCGGGCGGGGD